MVVGYSAANTANNTASTDVIPPSRLAEGIGYFGTSQAVASAIGLGAAFWGVMIDRVGYRVCFALIAAGELVLAASGMFCFRKQRKSPADAG